MAMFSLNGTQQEADGGEGAFGINAPVAHKNRKTEKQKQNRAVFSVDTSFRVSLVGIEVGYVYDVYYVWTLLC